ncbi:PDZ domain-containing protein 4 isoform X4 [Canis lupus baileyi]|uniref:PDZ domain-containing protein 4 isoform X4 n=1 Tax=Canis lupus dingo TaxID=286419 RepID=UPI00005A5F89|nr:PDZ domain-containing protein 4 isoform X4 [Canis lupus dingo]XP_038307169.1 PDZ domain-containing protein 4 isoform X4 [Canis lupus familiaris]XP_038444601.1 PDZ domain-containing protein 4 isoform X4 [Canis lupus familiaris]XP_853448.1 PDZ domain-containing protein 4 isoform X4 [Canis lupus familiaris]|eukprot:XP_853448.1 PDZ domain-containing protein 4 isoform X2 [Canis lupus familiaris]
MGCNMCVVQKPEEQYKVMLQVNGKELSKLSQEQTLEALRSSKEPLVIQVLRRSPRLRGDSSCHDLQLVDSGTQTDITFEHLMALGKLRPPTPPMAILEPPPISHEYYDPAEFMEGGPQEADRMDELEYEEVELYKTSHRDKLGLMVCYRTDDEEDLGIYVGEVNPNSIAAKDGRIREGDRIIQINGVDVQNREEAVAILSQEENTNISLLVARPESQLAKRWKDSDRDDFLDDFGSEHEGDLRARKVKSPPAQQLGNEEEKGVPDAGPGLSNSQELDSGVGRTDESTRTEESSEHDLLGDEPASAANTPGALRKSRDLHFSMDSLLAEGAGLGGGDVPGLTDEEYERYRELLEIKGHLENGNQLGLLFPRASAGNGALDVNRNESLGHEMAMLEEELRHLEFKCRNILRAQKMQQLRERCMKAWLLEEESLYDLGAGEPKKHELSDISELPEKSDKDSTSAYNTGESCRSTPLLAEPLPESPLRRAAAATGNSNLNRPPSGPAVAAHPKAAAAPQGSPAKFRSLSREPEVGRRPHPEERVRRSPKTGAALERVGPEGSPYLARRHRGQGQEAEHYHSCVQLAPPRGLEELGHGPLGLAGGPRVGGAVAATEAPRMEWKVKVRSDGTRYVAKRPVRDRLLKARALKIREERSGMTTDDDAVSEMKMGRYWSKEERKQHLIRAREQRKRREFMMQSRLECLREQQNGDSKAELNIIALSHRKTMKKRNKKILDNWITIQEMLAHGTRSADGKRVYNPLLSVTTV